MTADLAVLTVDQFYRHPPELVWQAITTPDLMARWLMRPDGSSRSSGSGSR